MDRTRPAELISGSFAGHEADQIQDFSQGDPGPDFGEGDARHGGSPEAETRGRRDRRRSGRPLGEQRRGTRNLYIRLIHNLL